MSLRVSGKNVDIGEALRARVEGRLDEMLDRYFDGARTGHVTIDREASGFRAEVVLHLATGVTLQANASAPDAYQAADQAAERLEKRLRRYKSKLKSYHAAAERAEAAEAPSYILAAMPEHEEAVASDVAPPVIAETRTTVRTLTVGMAVMQLDLADAPVVVFRNAAHGGLNVVYRRRDGNIGWIDPQLGTAS